MRAAVGDWIAARTLEENMAVFEAAEVTATPIYEIDQLLDDPHVQARGVSCEVPDEEAGSVLMHNIIPRLSETPGRFRSRGAGAGGALAVGAAIDRLRRRTVRRPGGRGHDQGGMTMRDDLPVWRSLMFVPVTSEKFVRTGADRGADAIILDLEDAVAPSQKDACADIDRWRNPSGVAQRRRCAGAGEPALADAGARHGSGGDPRRDGADADQGGQS